MEIALGAVDDVISGAATLFGLLGILFVYFFYAFVEKFQSFIDAIRKESSDSKPKFVIHSSESKGKMVYEIVEHEDSDKRVLMKERPDIKEFDPNSHEYLN